MGIGEKGLAALEKLRAINDKVYTVTVTRTYRFSAASKEDAEYVVLNTQRLSWAETKDPVVSVERHWPWSTT